MRALMVAFLFTLSAVALGAAYLSFISVFSGAVAEEASARDAWLVGGVGVLLVGVAIGAAYLAGKAWQRADEAAERAERESSS